MTYVLIGPMCAGKSTIAPLLARRLGRPRAELDDLRWAYYAEIGYDHDRARAIAAAEGTAAKLRHWKPFEAYAVERVLADYPEAVVDFGAGHSVYTDQTLFQRVAVALSAAEAVILLLPCADPQEAIAVLNRRLSALLQAELGTVNPAILAANAAFVRDPANARLATMTVYTAGHGPDQTVDEIVRRLGAAPYG